MPLGQNIPCFGQSNGMFVLKSEFLKLIFCKFKSLIKHQFNNH